jgi:hypothetical protein
VGRLFLRLIAIHCTVVATPDKLRFTRLR